MRIQCYESQCDQITCRLPLPPALRTVSTSLALPAFFFACSTLMVEGPIPSVDLWACRGHGGFFCSMLLDAVEIGE
jgi:hypothetical protein